MRENSRRTGAFYEQKAGEYLRKLGYEILEYNYRCPAGEIDVIARDGETLVFCEVKYRSNSRKGLPEEAVTPAKQKKISRCALYYLNRNREYLCVSCRFDVVGILGPKEEVVLIKNAFDYVE